MTAKRIRVPGHGLQREGRAHDETGRWLGGYYSGALMDGRGTNAGYGLCSCGEMSPLLTSTAARKRWHNEHKAEIEFVVPPATVLIEAARRIRDTRIDVDAGASEPPPKDPYVLELWDGGLVRQHFTMPHRRIPDYWELTPAGERWLAEAEKRRGL